jgi:hypothetical protein
VVRRFSATVIGLLIAAAVLAPAASAWPSEILTIQDEVKFQGGSATNHVTLSRADGYYVFNDSANVLDPGSCEPVDAHTARCPAASFRRIEVDLGYGDDYVADQLPEPDYAGPHVTILGMDGDDEIVGGAPGERIFYGRGSDTISGGGGEDTAVYGGDSVPGPMNISLDGVANDGIPGEHGNILPDVENIEGSSKKAETFVAGPGTRRIDAFGGHNVLIGSSGGEVLSGGDGDRFYAAGGNDQVLPGLDATVECGAGDDTVLGSSGDGGSYMSTCERTPLNPYGLPTFPSTTVGLEPTADLAGRALRVRVRCAANAFPCVGTLSARKVAASKRPAIGTTHFRIGDSRKRTVTIRISDAERKHLSHAQHVVVLARARDGRSRPARAAREQVVH